VGIKLSIWRLSFGQAERVIIWLGEATFETIGIMHFLNQLDRQRVENEHSISGRQWLPTGWSDDQNVSTV
jgi:hypothetical protein